MPQYGQKPGFTTQTDSVERSVLWGPAAMHHFAINATVDSTAVDAGNTPTSDLRPGLILGKKTSDGNLYAFNPDASDGTEYPAGVLVEGLSMLDIQGTVEDKNADVLIGGGVDASDLFIEGTAFTSSNAEHFARRMMALTGRFAFDDDPNNLLAGTRRFETIATDETVVSDDNGTVFICTTADVDATLPTIAPGLVFEFVRTDNFELAVISAAGSDMIVGNDVAANRVTGTTSGEQIGLHWRVESCYVSTTLKWKVTSLLSPFGTNTGTGLTFAITT